LIRFVRDDDEDDCSASYVHWETSFPR
jgi:hypothetical protein